MENKTRKRKSGGGRKPKAYTVFKRRLESERIEDADYAFWLHAETMRDTAQSLDLRLSCADWIANRVLGKPKEQNEHSGELIIRIERENDNFKNTDTASSTATY